MKFLVNLLICIHFTFHGSVFAQNAKSEAAADLIRMRDAFFSSTTYSMNMKYSFFPTYTSTQPVQKHTGFYCKQGEVLSYTELYGTTTIKNGELVLVKDDSSKVFMVKKFYNEETMTAPTYEQFEKMLGVCNAVEKIQELPAGEKGYVLVFENKIENLAKMEVVFDAGTYVMHKIRMYFDYPVEKYYYASMDASPQYNKPCLEIEYVNVKINAAVSKEIFSVKKYLVQVDKKWQLTPVYAGKYTLYDQTIVSK